MRDVVFSPDHESVPARGRHLSDRNAQFHFLPLVVHDGKRLGLYHSEVGAVNSHFAQRRGIGVPGAAVARSPMIDFTMTNDTWITLEGQDPLVSREAYVRKLIPILGIENYRDPIVSPHLDDNLSNGMPPTLFQTGGKEILLSDSLVMFQALEVAGQVAKLDLYDGMPHCFPMILPDTREARIADAKQVEWFRHHLELR